MRSHRVDRITDYASPTAGHWARVQPTRVALMPTPVGMQPTAYVRAAWAERRFGETPSVEVASVHDGTTWALRAEWSGVSAPHSDFPDAFAIALPVRGNPALIPRAQLEVMPTLPEVFHNPALVGSIYGRYLSQIN